jgi:hypothetical protein
MSVDIEKTGRLYVVPEELRDIPCEVGLSPDAPENLNYMAAYTIPVINYLDSHEPHIVIGCDRGGRLFSVAVQSMWYELRPDQSFPSVDGKVHFERISGSDAALNIEYRERLQQQLNNILVSGREHLSMHENISAERERLRVLFIDNCMINGRVKTLATELLAGHEADPYFAIMYGLPIGPVTADVYGNTEGFPRLDTAGLDKPEQLGFEYTENGVLVPKPTESSENNLRRLHDSVKKVAAIVKAAA